jgi:NADH-quinone oxidoreductase subunit C
MTRKLDELEAALNVSLADKFLQLKRERGEITLTVSPDHYLEVASVLKGHAALQFEQLIDLCGVDYSSYKDEDWIGPRFCTVLHLLSVHFNWRLRLKVFAPDNAVPMLPSVTSLWSSANWFEREAFDFYGIVYEGHTDLRRILTDYGFIGHPMRKDFPVSGHMEMRYDAETRRVIYQPVSIEPREITPRVIREDHYGGLR